MKYCLIIVLCFYHSISIGGLFGPNNYDECVLESMKGVTSDQAAKAIIYSCQSKFPEKRPNDSVIPPEVQAKLDGRAGTTNYGYFKGSIYNGNKDWIVTQVTVVLSPKTKDKSLASVRRTKEYNVYITVHPLANSDFSVSADGGDSNGYDWAIVGARGYKSR